MGQSIAARCWIELGVANRHIARVVDGEFHLAVVELEIQQCLRRVKQELETRQTWAKKESRGTAR